MAKNPTSEQFDAYVAARKDGKSAHDAQVAAGLSHSQAEFHWLRTQPVAEGGMAELVGKTEATPKAVAALREKGESWGRIAVHIDQPEGSARKLYAQATGNKSQGQRVGKGGRFYYHENALYADALKGTGTVIGLTEKGRDAAVEAAADQRELLNAEVPALLETYAKEVGRKAPKGYTKAQLCIAIRKVRREKASA